MSGLLQNISSGGNPVTVNSVIGTNVTGVVENPSNVASSLVLNNANTYFGDTDGNQRHR